MGVAAEALTREAQGRSQRLTETVRLSTSVVVENLILPPPLAGHRKLKSREATAGRLGCRCLRPGDLRPQAHRRST